MGELKERIAVLAGAALLAAIGRNRFYQMAQDRDGPLGRIASAFCQGHAGRVGENYAIFRENRDRDRITDIALRFYSDASLHGYGDHELPRPDAKRPLLEQGRARVVPLIEAEITKGSKSVLEIGTGNGDVIAYLAQRYPEVKFVGIDLSVANAAKKHQHQNLTFKEGYPLDLLQSESCHDIVFASSTFCIFAPKELKAYLAAISGAKRLILSDPITFGNTHNDDPEPKSRHMDLYMWWHNYRGYLMADGWSVDYLETVTHFYPHNPNAKFVLLSASRG